MDYDLYIKCAPITGFFALVLIVNLHNYCSDDIDINMKYYNTYVKVSGGARHYLPCKASFKLG